MYLRKKGTKALMRKSAVPPGDNYFHCFPLIELSLREGRGARMASTGKAPSHARKKKRARGATLFDMQMGRAELLIDSY